MRSFSKKIMCISALSLFMSSPSFAKEGYECAMPYAQLSNKPTEFVCRDNDDLEGRITIKEIYEKNYRVVATFTAHDVPKIIIEEQD